LRAASRSEVIGEFRVYPGQRFGRQGWFYLHLTHHPGLDEDGTLGGWKSTLEAARELAEAFSNPLKEIDYVHAPRTP
jgi:hypothetical protein